MCGGDVASQWSRETIEEDVAEDQEIIVAGKGKAAKSAVAARMPGVTIGSRNAQSSCSLCVTGWTATMQGSAAFLPALQLGCCVGEGGLNYS